MQTLPVRRVIACMPGTYVGIYSSAVHRCQRCWGAGGPLHRYRSLPPRPNRGATQSRGINHLLSLCCRSAVALPFVTYGFARFTAGPLAAASSAHFLSVGTQYIRSLNSFCPLPVGALILNTSLALDLDLTLAPQPAAVVCHNVPTTAHSRHLPSQRGRARRRGRPSV
jgi:hypothetical protein